nr:MAG TPA: YopX protein [Caudoviricetes sp.]
MRTENIKFKAKKTLDGKWIKGDLVHHRDSDNVWITDYENQLTSPVVPFTVCQFTGEKDMNGKEIYTGDIISNIETGSVIEVAWNDRLKRLDCKFFNTDTGLKVPFGIFVSRYKRIVVLRSKFDKEE